MPTFQRERIEAQIAEAIQNYHAEQHGHKPVKCEVNITGTFILAALSGIFTATEESLCQSDDDRKTVQGARRDHRALSRRDSEELVRQLVHVPVLRSFYDLDVRSGESIEIYVLEYPMEFKAFSAQP